MKRSSVVSTLAYLINLGISSDAYYTIGPKNEALKDAKAFWDKDERLCFRAGGRVFRFRMEDVVSDAEALTGAEARADEKEGP